MSERAEGKSGHPVCAIGLTQLPDDVLKHIGCFCDERTLKALSCTCVKLKIMFSVVLATRAANRIEQSTATKAAHPVFVSFHPYHFQHTETLIIFFQSQGERDTATAWVVGTEAGLEDALQEVFVPAQLFAVGVTRCSRTSPCIPADHASSRGSRPEGHVLCARNSAPRQHVPTTVGITCCTALGSFTRCCTCITICESHGCIAPGQRHSRVRRSSRERVREQQEHTDWAARDRRRRRPAGRVVPGVGSVAQGRAAKQCDRGPKFAPAFWHSFSATTRATTR